MIQIDVEYLKNCKLQLSPFDSILLFLIYNKENLDVLFWCDYNLNLLQDKISKLQDAGFLKIVGDLPEGIEWRQKYLDLLPKEVKQTNTVESWIEEWRELWPNGIKSGGYYLKSNREDLLNKMNKFVKKYKYTKEQIFEATNNYLTEQKNKGWAYTKLANYFIDKDNVSTLASYCANIGSKVENKSLNKML